jgi:hypothetical protein
MRISLGGSHAEGRLVLEPLFLVVSLSAAVPLRRNESRVVWKPVLLDVIPVNACTNQKHTEARGAGCGSGSRGAAERRCSSLGKAGGACLRSAFAGRCRPTRPCSRPLRARDRWLFDGICDALAAADGQAVGRQPISISTKSSQSILNYTSDVQ